MAEFYREVVAILRTSGCHLMRKGPTKFGTVR